MQVKADNQAEELKKLFCFVSGKCRRSHVMMIKCNVSLHALQRVTLVPDPCTLLMDGVTFGLTSTDILFHMGAEEISW